MGVFGLIGLIVHKIKSFCYFVLREYYATKFASFGKGSWFDHHCVFTYENIEVGNNVNIGPNCLIRSSHGKIVIGNHVMIGPGVHIHGGNHVINQIGVNLDEVKKESTTDGILQIEDNVWIGSYSVLLKGSHICRGAVIGAGSVVRHEIPPYAIVSGNPCKIVGFRFTPEEIIEHEKLLYKEEDRIDFETLEHNYKKYFLNRLKDIKVYTKLY